MNAEDEKINVWGARVHNLKNVDVEIPRNSLTVITGLSGSGKSSLAFDTIFAEGQRRYIETFSAYARNFLGNMERPDVDKITGLEELLPPPIINIGVKFRQTLVAILRLVDVVDAIAIGREGVRHLENALGDRDGER